MKLLATSEIATECLIDRRNVEVDREHKEVNALIVAASEGERELTKELVGNRKSNDGPVNDAIYDDE